MPSNSPLKRPRRACGGIALIGIAGIAALIVSAFFFSSHRAMNRDSAMATAKEWVRFTDIPATATEVSVETGGSAFSREFTIRFRDSSANIRAWLAASPGPVSETPKRDSSGWIIYSYSAGGGAQFAEIRVSPTGDAVVIRTYWS